MMLGASQLVLTTIGSLTTVIQGAVGDPRAPGPRDGHKTTIG